jgi:hypothetical protein
MMETLGIMVSTAKQRKMFLQNYMRHYHFSKLRVFSFSPSDIDWKRRRIHGLRFRNNKWETGSFPFPKVIYNRCYNSDMEIIHRLEQIIGRNKCFNHINQFDKLKVHHAITRWLSPHVPDTLPYSNDTLEQMVHLHKLVYLKPCHGHMGKGVYRIEQKDTRKYHISNHYVMPSIIVGSIGQLVAEAERITGQTPYLIQKGIYTLNLNNQTFDIRVLVQKNKDGLWSTTNVISRIAHVGCFNTSICDRVCLTESTLKKLYPIEAVRDKMNTIYNLSLRAAEILELDYGIHLGEVSVDLAIDLHGHAWIIELNGMPQKSLYKDLTISRRAIYSRPLEYGYHLSKQ